MIEAKDETALISCLEEILVRFQNGSRSQEGALEPGYYKATIRDQSPFG